MTTKRFGQWLILLRMNTQRTSSYNLISGTPRSVKPSHITHAVIPLPQVVTIGRSPWMIWQPRSSPTPAIKDFLIAGVSAYNVYAGAPVASLFCKKVSKGTLNEFGMCPLGTSGRGSGSTPANLQSWSISIHKMIADLPPRRPGVYHNYWGRIVGNEITWICHNLFVALSN